MPSRDHPSGIFLNATVDSTNLVLPISSLPSFGGTVSAGSNGGSEAVFGILEALMEPVTPLSNGGFTRASVANSVRLLPNGSGELTKTYTFVLKVGLDLDSTPLNIITSWIIIVNILMRFLW